MCLFLNLLKKSPRGERGTTRSCERSIFTRSCQLPLGWVGASSCSGVSKTALQPCARQRCESRWAATRKDFVFHYGSGERGRGDIVCAEPKKVVACATTAQNCISQRDSKVSSNHHTQGHRSTPARSIEKRDATHPL